MDEWSRLSAPSGGVESDTRLSGGDRPCCVASGSRGSSSCPPEGDGSATPTWTGGSDCPCGPFLGRQARCSWAGLVSSLAPRLRSRWRPPSATADPGRVAPLPHLTGGRHTRVEAPSGCGSHVAHAQPEGSALRQPRTRKGRKGSDHGRAPGTTTPVEDRCPVVVFRTDLACRGRWTDDGDAGVG